MAKEKIDSQALYEKLHAMVDLKLLQKEVFNPEGLVSLAAAGVVKLSEEITSLTRRIELLEKGKEKRDESKL